MQTSIQYISFYTDGSAAKKVEPKPVRKTVAAAPKPVVRQKKRPVIKVDPVAVAGIVFAFIMLITMASSLAEYRSCVEKNAQMSQYILSLQQENAQLQETYENGYDLDQIREIATAIGMVPVDQAQKITVEVHIPEAEQQMSFWQSMAIFLAGLFA